ncbi:hypothetical protein [Haloterrigena sp. H1]|nr:hypothetical protein [Haloterrigena sp. H1]
MTESEVSSPVSYGLLSVISGAPATRPAGARNIVTADRIKDGLGER